MASKGQIVERVESDLEDFVYSLKYLNNFIRVRFFLKMWDYGAKLVIDATDQITEKTFFNILVKIWSVEEIESFKLMLEGLRTSIEKKCQCDNSSSDTDWLWQTIQSSQINSTEELVTGMGGFLAARMWFLSAWTFSGMLVVKLRASLCEIMEQNYR